MLVVGPAAAASGFARVRLVNARSGASQVGLKVVVAGVAGQPIGPAAYGQATPYAKLAPGNAQISLTGTSSGATATQALTDGANYTVVLFSKGSKGASLKVFHDGTARKRTGRLRVINAGPELGSPNVMLGQRTVAEKVGFHHATPYASQQPGSYELAVTKPGSSMPIFKGNVTLSAGVATTAFLLGSGGSPEKVVTATDDTLTPPGAPGTGLGGLAGPGGHPWLLIALAAGLAGLLGGGWQLALARRSTRR
jgi:hypothetical protein